MNGHDCPRDTACAACTAWGCWRCFFRWTVEDICFPCYDKRILAPLGKEGNAG